LVFSFSPVLVPDPKIVRETNSPLANIAADNLGQNRRFNISDLH
jgi:hypothetical protein